MTLQAALDLVLYIADELDINRVMLGDVGYVTFFSQNIKLNS